MDMRGNQLQSFSIGPLDPATGSLCGNLRLAMRLVAVASGADRQMSHS